MSKHPTDAIRSSLVHTLQYFDFFEYPPSLEELFQFSPVECSKKAITRAVQSLEAKRTVFLAQNRVALRAEVFDTFHQNENISQKEMVLLTNSLHLFTWIPSVMYIGVSGSLSMLDADSQADLDIFLITKKDTVWLSRACILTITRVFSLFGHRTLGKLCWNIMIEDHDLALPSHKRNEYTAHELVQMKTLFERHNMHARLLAANSWISKIFPNVQVNYTENGNSYSRSKQYKVLEILDHSLGFLQRLWLAKRGYGVQQYGRHVWFIQEDFEKKIPLKLKKVQEK